MEKPQDAVQANEHAKQTQLSTSERGDRGAASRAETAGNGGILAPQDVYEDEASSQSHVPANASSANDSKRKRSADDSEDADRVAQFSRQFSLAQVDVKVKRARLEANIAVQDEIKTLRLALLKAQQEAEEKERQRGQAEARYVTLQESMQSIVKLHQRTLLGMRDNIKLENLVASLDKEKATKESLKRAFQQQNAELLHARQRIESLNGQIIKYQKTETALAQSLTHFQHQFASKDYDKAATVEQIKHALEEQHRETREALENEVDRVIIERDALQARLQALQGEFESLEETATSAVHTHEKHDEEMLLVRSRMESLEREKDVLSSKVDQIQKADAQLRSKIQGLEEEVLTLTHKNEELRLDNVELSKIAEELMDMAENQHREKEQLTQAPDAEGYERLVQTRTRLRESLG